MVASLALSLATIAVAADRPSPLRSGVEFTGADARAMQADDFANPGMLWVSRGEKLWSERVGAAGKSCADCHGDASRSMKGIAAHGVHLEARIDACRRERQKAPGFAPETPDLVALSAYLAHQSRGVPIAVEETPQFLQSVERGRLLYHRRIGQMNLACAQCHDESWGKRIGPETISQGHPSAFPAYRLSWESAGSLARRIRACYSGVRAEMPAYGSAELRDLEAYLAWRARGLPMEAPGVRR